MSKTKKRAAKKAAALAAEAPPAAAKPGRQGGGGAAEAARKAASRDLDAAFKRADAAGALAALGALPLPSAAQCNKALSAAGKAGDCGSVLELLGAMLRGERGLPKPTAVTFAAAAKFTAVAGRPDEALDVLAPLLDGKVDGVEADTVAFNVAIGACKTDAPRFADLALSLLDRAGDKADVVTFNSCLGCFEKAGGRADSALELLDRCPCPNAISFTHVIGALAAERRSDEALAVLRRMSGAGVAPNVHSYNAAISALERCGRWEEALALLREMEAREGDAPAPDPASVRSALFACCGAKPGPPRLAEALELIRRVDAGELAPGAPAGCVSYRVLIRACDVAGEGAVGALQLLCAAEGTLPGEAQEGGGLPRAPVRRLPPWSPPPEVRPATPPGDDAAAAAAPTALPGPSPEALRRRFRVVYHEPGLQRMPRNRRDLDLYVAEPGTVRFDPCDEGRALRHDVPGVPGAFVVSGVLTAGECARLRAAAEAVGYLPDEPLRAGGGADDPQASYTGIDFMEWLLDDSVLGPIWDRVRPHLPPALGGGGVAGVNARFRLFRYGAGGVYRPHIDGAWPGSGMVDGQYQRDAFGDRHSRLTFLIYLNDDFDGGPTTFYVPSAASGCLEARSVAPQMGAVLCFPHGEDRDSPVHEGGVVREGAKYVMRSDVLYFVPKNDHARRDGAKAHASGFAALAGDIP